MTPKPVKHTFPQLKVSGPNRFGCWVIEFPDLHQPIAFKSKEIAVAIVKACNNHEKLLKACKLALKDLICSNKTWESDELLKQAIAEAEMNDKS